MEEMNEQDTFIANENGTYDTADDTLAAEISQLNSKIKEYESAYVKLSKRFDRLSKAYSSLLNTFLDNEE